MKDSKLIRFLRSLSPEARTEFQAYVDSPLFNRRKTLSTLLEILYTQGLTTGARLSREAVYAKIFGDQPYNARSLRTLMAQLQSLLRDYMAFRQYRQDEAGQLRDYLAQLRSAGLHKYAPAAQAHAAARLRELPLRAADRHHALMRLAESELIFRQHGTARMPADHLETAQQHLLSGFLIRLLRYELQRVTLEGNFSEPQALTLPQELIDAVSRQLTEVPTAARMYSLLLRLFAHPADARAYTEVREILSRTQAEFSPAEAHELYIATLNYTARRVNDGNKEFLTESFSLYEEMLERQLIIEDGKISPFHFKNIVNVALRLQRDTWAEAFIREWKLAVRPDHGSNAFDFSMGMLHFYRKAYTEAARCFNRVLNDHQDIFYGLNARGYLLQIYYETGEIRSLESLAHAFRIKLSRGKQISAAKREQYLSFLRHLMRLLNTPPQDYKRLEKLRSEIAQKPEKGMGAVWLLEKIDAIRGEA